MSVPKIESQSVVSKQQKRTVLSDHGYKSQMMRKQRVQSLSSYLQHQMVPAIPASKSNEKLSSELIHKYRLRAFARLCGVTSQQVQRWLDNNAIFSDGGVYLQKTCFKRNPVAHAEDLNDPRKNIMAPFLNDYIARNFQGNMAEFARSLGVTQQQMYRWVKKAHCLWLHGELCRLQFEIPKRLNLHNGKLGSSTHQFH